MTNFSEQGDDGPSLPAPPRAEARVPGPVGFMRREMKLRQTPRPGASPDGAIAPMAPGAWAEGPGASAARPGIPLSQPGVCPSRQPGLRALSAAVVLSAGQLGAALRRVVYKMTPRNRFLSKR